MENLFFTLQENKQFKRQIQILHYLNHAHIPVSTTELARELECSAPTLRSDIHLLNSSLPENIQIIWRDREGCELRVSDSVSVDSCLAQLAKETLAFQVIDNIFHRKLCSFDHAAEFLFLSSNTLRRVIHHLNQVLKTYCISISTTDLDFVGKESDIRFFLFTFYSDFRESFTGSNPEDMDTETYIEMLLSIQKAGLPQLHISHFRAAIWMMVIKKRLAHKNFITLDKKLTKEVCQQDRFHLFYKTFRFFLSYFFTTDTPALEEGIWCYLICLHCVSYSESQTVDEETKYIYHREVSPKIDKIISRFLETIFPAELFEDDSLEKIRAFLNNLYFLNQLSPQFEQVSFPLKKFIKESNHQVYSLWYERLQLAVPKQLFPIRHLEDAAVTLTILHLSILIKPRKKELRILFSFQGEAGYDDYLVQSSKQLLTENVSAEYHFEKVITEQLIEKKGIDLVVCNYDLPVETLPCKTVHLSYIPTSAEWHYLSQTIHKMNYFNQENVKESLPS
ncbi:M protein trans-acting positive regulator [Enterococcus faecalis 13-SD-W-01]|nr:M protein trans-acting positive regulator [Enterococcus faecalis 13-SD-W-01]